MSEIKDKFIDDLAEGLDNANITNNEIVLKDYIALYDEKISKGLTDMEVVISLGDPSDIVKSLNKKLAKTKVDKETEIKETLKDTVSDLMVKPNEKPLGKPDRNKKGEKKSRRSAFQPEESTTEVEIISIEEIKTLEVIPNTLHYNIKLESDLLLESLVDKSSSKVADILEEPVTIEASLEELQDKKEEKEPAIEEKNNKTKAETKVKEKKVKEPKVKRFKKPRKFKKRYLLRFLLFIIIMITSIAVPIAIIYGGLIFLLPIPLSDRLMQAGISFAIAIMCIIINNRLRNLTKNMILRRR